MSIRDPPAEVVRWVALVNAFPLLNAEEQPV